MKDELKYSCDFIHTQFSPIESGGPVVQHNARVVQSPYVHCRSKMFRLKRVLNSSRYMKMESRRHYCVDLYGDFIHFQSTFHSIIMIILYDIVYMFHIVVFIRILILVQRV